jgi:hypothetical protein
MVRQLVDFAEQNTTLRERLHAHFLLQLLGGICNLIKKKVDEYRFVYHINVCNCVRESNRELLHFR